MEDLAEEFGEFATVEDAYKQLSNSMRNLVEKIEIKDKITTKIRRIKVNSNQF